MILALESADFGVAVFRATNSGCSRAKSRPAGFCRRQLVASPRSRYRIEMVQVTFDCCLRWFIRILYNFLRSLSIENRKISSANRSSHKQETHPTNQSGAKPHSATSSHFPSKPKTSPQDPATTKSKSNFRPRNGGVLRGSSGRVREVWRVGRPLSKGSPYPPRSFLFLSKKTVAKRGEM